MKYVASCLLFIFSGMTIYWAINAPVIIPTLIVAWTMLWLQTKYECFN